MRPLARLCTELPRAARQLIRRWVTGTPEAVATARATEMALMDYDSRPDWNEVDGLRFEQAAIAAERALPRLRRWAIAADRGRI